MTLCGFSSWRQRRTPQRTKNSAKNEELRLCNGIAKRDNCIPSGERKSLLHYAMDFLFHQDTSAKNSVNIWIPSTARFQIISFDSLYMHVYVILDYSRFLIDFWVSGSFLCFVFLRQTIPGLWIFLANF